MFICEVLHNLACSTCKNQSVTLNRATAIKVNT